MALLFLDSFDHYVTADFQEKWTSSSYAGTTISAGTGRRSSASVHFINGTGNITKLLVTSGDTIVCGFAAKISSLSSTINLVGFHDATANKDHVWLKANTNGSIGAYRSAGGVNSGGGTLLGTTAAGVLAVGTFVYIELKVLLHGSAGTVTVRVNEAAVLTLTGQNTTQGTLVWNTFWIADDSPASPVLDVDDVYVLDGSGSAPLTDFLGDCRVDARYPTAEGASSAWTPLSGTDNALMVDETAPDDDTTYNSTATVGATDTHVVQDAPVVGATLYGVQLSISMKKSDSGTCSVAPVVRHSGTDYPGTASSPGTSYAYAVTPYGLNPGTSAAWTEAGFNAAEFGYKRTA